MAKIIISLLSAGIDSTVAATMAASDPNNLVYLFTTAYGLAAETVETKRAQQIGEWLKATYPNVREHFVMDIDGGFGWSKEERESFYPDPQGTRIPLRGFFAWHQPKGGWPEVGYLSVRDEMQVLLAAAGLEARLHENPEATEGEIQLAFNRDDITNYPDTEPTAYTKDLTHILAYKDVSRVEGKRMSITLPLIGLSKVEVIKQGLESGAPLHLTWSCYFGQDTPCGKCSQCTWRKEAFAEAGIEDPAK